MHKHSSLQPLQSKKWDSLTQIGISNYTHNSRIRIYMYAYTYVHTIIEVCVHVHAYVYVYEYEYVYVCICDACVCACVWCVCAWCVCVCDACVCMCMCMCLCVVCVCMVCVCTYVSKPSPHTHPHRTGELTNRLASDTQVVQNALTTNLSQLCRYGLQMFASVGFMFYISPKLTAVLLSVLPIVVVSAVQYGQFIN